MTLPNGPPLVFALFIDSEEFGCDRDQLIKELLERGIQAKPYFYPPLHEQDAYAQFKTAYLGKLDFTEKVSRSTISLPLYSHMKMDEIVQVVTAMKQIHQNCKERQNRQQYNNQQAQENQKTNTLQFKEGS